MAHAGFPPGRLAQLVRRSTTTQNNKSARALSPTSLISPKARQPLTAPTRRATLLIALTQMTGWGTTYHLPIILGHEFSADLGLPMEVIFSGLSVMLLVSAFLSPRVGVMIDRLGPGRFLCAGSIFAAAGLLTLANARGLAGYAIAWTLLGLTMTTMLGNASLVALARVAGPQARRAITTMLLFTATNPFIFYPITTHLAGAFGWRTTLMIYAAVHLFVGLPAHWLIGRLKPAEAAAGANEPIASERFGVLPASERRSALVLVMISFSAQGVINWGVQPNMINMFVGLGLPIATAIFFGSLHGPSQLAGRLVDVGSRGQMPPLTMGLIAGALAPLGLVILTFAGQSQIAALVGISLFGMSAGLNSIARAAIPLHLFGRDTYGAILGRIALPMNIACAIAPVFFAAVISRAGPTTGLLVGAAFGVVATWVMLRLDRRTKAAIAAPVAAPAE